MSTTSSDGTSSTRQSKAPNFSRPKPLPQSQSQTQAQAPPPPPPSALKTSNVKKRPNSDQRRVHIIDAFHEPHSDLPSEPRFDDNESDSDRTEPTDSEASTAGIGTAWDGHDGELDSRRRKKRYDAQRYESTRPMPASRTSAESSHTMTTSTSISSVAAPAPNIRLQDARPTPQILKRVSVDQHSEHIDPSSNNTHNDNQWEDTASHHTVSSSGEDSGSFDVEGRWQSSDHDTSGLSPAEIRKLERKGINPALYVEMQEAKKGKGKKWPGSLLGNGFLN